MSIVGSVSVRVVPSFTGVHRSIAAGFAGAQAPVAREASRVGRHAGTALIAGSSAVMGRNFTTAFRGAFGQAQGVATAAGSAAGTSFMSRFGTAAGRGTAAVAGVASSIGRQFTTAGTLAGTGFIASFTRMLGPLTGILSLGAILGGGFNRLADIDDAEAKFRGLGYSAEEIDTQMDSALASVEGTTIGLNQAATAAVGAAGAGVEMGEDMTAWLSAIADATAMSSVEYDHMADIMNKVRGQGRVMGGDLQQMGQNGFEAATILAEHMGIGVDKVRELASQGEISAELFQEAIEGQIGGAAQEMSQTLRGSIAEAVFQIKILSAEFLESSGLADLLRDSMLNFAGFLENTVTPAVSDVIDWFKEWQDVLRPIATILAGILGGFLAFKGVALIIGGITTAVHALSGAIRAIPIVGWIAMAIGALIAFFQYTELGQEIWEKVWGVIKSVTETVVDWLTERAWPVIARGWEIISDAASSAWDNFIGPVITWMWERLVGFADWWTGTGWPAIKTAWEAFAEIVQDVWENYISPALGEISSQWDNLVETFTDLWENNLKPVFQDIGDAATEMWETYLKPAWEGLKDALQTLWDEHGWILEEVALLLLALGAAPIILALGSLVVALYAIAAALRVVAEISEIVVMAMTGDWQGLGQKFAEYGSWISNTLGLVREGFDRTRDGVARATGVMAARFADMATTLRDQTVGSIGGTVAIFMGRVGGMRDDFFRRMGEMTRRFQELASNFAGTVAGSITQTFLNFRSRVSELRDNFSGRMADIRSRFGSLAGSLRDTWASRIRPVFSEFGSFLRNNLVSRVSEAVGRVEEIWNRIRSAFARPINAVISGVFNNGLVRAFNNIARFVPGVSEIDRIPTIGAYAKGGRVSEDWYIAGEEGPELIHRGRESHRVYTAEETAKALSATGNEDVPEDVARKAAGSRPSEALLPMGPAGAAGSAIGGIVERVRDVVDWARGGLESAAKKFLSPIFSEAAGIADQGHMGALGLGVARKLRDDILDWAGKDDDEFSAALSGDGAGLFDGPTGAWKRPSRGPVTSWYGPRWGSIHSGIDIAGGGPTFAAYNGIVQGVGWNILPGRTGVGILLSHGGGLQTYYGHNPVGGPRVSVGQPVSAGQHIGYQGATGNVTGTHLHWEMLRGGRAQNVNSMFRDKGGLLYPGINRVLNETGGAEYVFNQRQFDNLNRLAEGRNGRSAAIEQLTINGVVPSEMERGLQRAVFRELKRQGVPVAVS